MFVWAWQKKKEPVKELWFKSRYVKISNYPKISEFTHNIIWTFPFISRFFAGTIVHVSQTEDVSQLTRKIWGIFQKSSQSNHQHPTTTKLSATSRHSRTLKFCTDTHYTNLIQLTNCHCDICPGNICLDNICLDNICPYQEYLSC